MGPLADHRHAHRDPFSDARHRPADEAGWTHFTPSDSLETVMIRSLLLAGRDEAR